MDGVKRREANRALADRVAAQRAAHAAGQTELNAAHVRTVLSDPVLLEPMRGTDVPRESFKGFAPQTHYEYAAHNAAIAADHRFASAAEQRAAAETAQRTASMLAQLEQQELAARAGDHAGNARMSARWADQSAAAQGRRADERFKRYETTDQTPFYGSFGVSDR